MKHIVIKLILAVITATLALQPCDFAQGKSLDREQAKGATALTAVWAARPLGPGQQPLAASGGNLRPRAAGEGERLKNAPYEVELTRIDNQTWGARSEKGIYRYKVLQASASIPIRYVDQFREVAGLILLKDYINRIVNSFDKPVQGEYIVILLLSVSEDWVAGAYVYDTHANNLRFIGVGRTHRGTGATDILLEDMKARLFNNNSEARFHVTVFRKSDRAASGEGFMTVEEFRRALGVNSIVTIKGGFYATALETPIESSVLRPLAMSEKQGGAAAPKSRATVALEQLRTGLSSALKHQTDVLMGTDSIYLKQKIPTDGTSIPSQQLLSGSDSARGTWAGIAQQELISLSKRAFAIARGAIASDDQKAILGVIPKLQGPLANRDIRGLRQVYNEEIFSLLDRLILEYELRSAVDKRNLAEADQLVQQLNAPEKGIWAILVDCPFLRAGPQKGLSAKNDSSYGDKAAKISGLRDDVISVLERNGVRNTFMFWWLVEELGADTILHPRDNLKGDKDMPLFAVVVAEVARGADNSITTKFIFHDNGGGVRIDELLSKIKASVGDNIEEPSGRGIYVLCSFLFKEEVGNPFLCVVSQSERVYFTGFIEEKGGPQHTKPEEYPVLENGFYVRAGCSVSVATPLEQMRETEAAANSTASSVLRPRPANERRPIRPITSFETEVPIDESAYPLINNIMPLACAVSIQGIISHFDTVTFEKAGCLKATIYRVGRELRPDRQNMGTIAITISNPDAPEDESVSFIATKTIRSASIDMKEDPAVITGEVTYRLNLVKHLRGTSGIKTEVKFDRETPNPRRFAEIITETFEHETHLRYWEKWRGQAWKIIAAKPAKITSLANSRSLPESILRPLATDEKEISSQVTRLAEFLGQLNGRVITERKRLRHMFGWPRRSFTLETLPRSGAVGDFIIRVNAPYEVRHRRWTLGNKPFDKSDMEEFAGPRTVGIIMLRGGYYSVNYDSPSLYIGAIDFTPAERMGLYSVTCKQLASICPVGTRITFVEIAEKRTWHHISLGWPFLDSVLGRPFKGTGFETAYAGKKMANGTGRTLEAVLEKTTAGQPWGMAPHVYYTDLIGDRDVVYTKTRLQHEPLITFLMLNRFIPVRKFRNVLLTGITPQELKIFTQMNREARITVIDLDKRQLEALMDFLSRRPRIAERVSLFRADAANLDPRYFPDNYFDFAYLEVLDESAYGSAADAEHTLPLIAREQTRVVAPGGYIFHYTQRGLLYYKPAIDSGLLELVHPDVSIVFQRKITAGLECSVLRPRAAEESKRAPFFVTLQIKDDRRNIAGSKLHIRKDLLDQLDPEDIDYIEQISIANDEELAVLNKKSGGRVRIACYEQYVRTAGDLNGETVYLTLRKPAIIAGRTIVILRLKGIRPLLENNNSLRPYTYGFGFVERPHMIDRNGDISIGNAVIKPIGTMTYDEVEKEFSIMERTTDTFVRTDAPLGIGEYISLDFNGERTGYLIAGMESGDVRLTVENDEVSIARYDSLSGIAEGYGDFQQHLWGVLRVLGKTLRAYHDMGNCHYYPHLGNIGLLRQDGHYHVILRDLCTTVPIDANYLPGQRAGLRFIDLATVLKDLSYNPQHTTFFLLGYFHEMLPNNPEFISMIRECVDSGSFRKGLDLLQQKCNFMELAPANPYFGRIIQNLHTQETNWRSLLESI